MAISHLSSDDERRERILWIEYPQSMNNSQTTSEDEGQ
jgi:hypothetical protein